MTAFDIQAAIALAAEKGKDLNETETGGGGGYVPPAAGPCMLRFVGYIETGKKTREGMDRGKKWTKVSDMAKFIFELHGKNYPVAEVDGEKIPVRMSFDLSISRNERAIYSKLFGAMNWEGTAKVFPQLLGKDFMGTVFHEFWGEEVDVEVDGKTIKRGKNVSAKLRDDSGFSIRSPFIQVPTLDEVGVPTGEFKSTRMPVPEAITPLRLFLWDFPSKGMWDSLFIDGKYPDRKDDKGNTIPGKTKNVYQAAILAAENFSTSPIADIVDGLDAAVLDDLPDGTNDIPVERDPADVAAMEDSKSVTAQGGAAADPLAAI